MAKSKAKKEEVMLEENTVIETPIEEGTDVSPTIGIVSNCEKLNIRQKPTKTNSSPVCVVDAKTELTIDEDKSTKTWYKVITKDGKEGFCMKEFITIK